MRQQRFIHFLGLLVLICGYFFLRADLASSSVQTRMQTCSENWYITGYYAPREEELPDTAEQISVVPIRGSPNPEGRPQAPTTSSHLRNWHGRSD